MEFPLIIFSIFLLVRFPGEDVSISLGETEGTVLFDSACAATKRAVPPLYLPFHGCFLEIHRDF